MEVKIMEKYECLVCGYIYDPRNGDKKGDIPANTSFTNLPETWTCPECGAEKTLFEKFEEEEPQQDEGELEDELTE
jgi:rubredoxin